MYPNGGYFDYSNWMRPSRATSLPRRWINRLAWVGVLALAYLVYSGLHWLFHALGGMMQ